MCTVDKGNIVEPKKKNPDLGWTNSDEDYRYYRSPVSEILPDNPFTHQDTATLDAALGTLSKRKNRNFFPQTGWVSSQSHFAFNNKIILRCWNMSWLMIYHLKNTFLYIYLSIFLLLSFVFSFVIPNLQLGGLSCKSSLKQASKSIHRPVEYK